MEDEDTSYEDLNIYSEDVDEMDFKVIFVAVISFCCGILGILIAILNFSIVFYPGPLILLIAAVSLFVIICTLGILSLITAWALWQLEPWAWRAAMAVSIASLVFDLISLTLIPLVLNAFLIYLLRDHQLKRIYDDIVVP